VPLPTGPITGFQKTPIAGSDDLGDGGPVEKAWLRFPSGIAVDAGGAIYFADRDSREIRRIGLDRIISRFAGIFDPSSGSPDGTPARDAHFGFLGGLAFSPNGELYFTEEQKIRKIDSSGLLRTVAGRLERGNPDFAGDGGPATDARLAMPSALAFGPDGSLYFVDQGNHRVRRVTPDGIVRTIAGNGSTGSSGDGGPATDAQLGSNMGDIAVDRSGNLYIRDTFNARVRRVAPDGIITTVAGTGRQAYSGDNIPAVQASIGAAQGLAADSAGNLYVGDQYRIRKIGSNGIITTIAGDGTGGMPVDGMPALNNRVGSPYRLLAGMAGDVYVVDGAHQRIERIDASGILHIVAANTDVRDGGPATAARLNVPQMTIAGRNGEIYIADTGNHRVRRVDRDGTIMTVAGNGREDGPGSLPSPRALLLDQQGNLLIASGAAVRKLSQDGTLTLVAGGDMPGYSGDEGPATKAQLTMPTTLAFDTAGYLLIGDGPNHAIRRVSPDGIISTWLGGNKAAETVRLNWPAGLAFDLEGNLLIADSSDYRVLRYSPGKPIVTVAGNGGSAVTFRLGGDGGRPAAGAGIGSPSSVAADTHGNIFIGTAGLFWVSPDGVLHQPPYNAPGVSGVSIDRDGTILGIEVSGKVYRFTPLR
jgi:sugar lactone lactonase YvrE